MAKILVVDDEKPILVMVKKILQMEGHEVTILDRSSDVEKQNLQQYDLILLDVMMPEPTGFAVCEMIRNQVDCPILFLTAKTDENGIVEGLSVGGDDYITKPFGKKELVARVSAHLRREHREKVVRLSFEQGYFNLSSRELVVNGEVVALTKSEYSICEYLAKHAGQVFSREQIYEAVFGYDGESDDSTIAMHIKNTRTKLSSVGISPIKTVWGIGYKWETE